MSFRHWTLPLILLCAGLASAQQESSTPAAPVSAEAQAPSAQETAVAPKEEESLQARLDQVKAEIERAKEGLPPDATTSPKVDLLNLLQSAIERRISLESRRKEIEKLIADEERQREEFRENGLDMVPPYPIKLLDTLLDEVQRAERELETNLVSQKTFEAAFKRAEATRQAAEQTRRKARDDLDALQDETRRPLLNAALPEAQLRQRIAVEEEALAKGQLEMGRLERSLGEARLARFQDMRDYVEARVVFSSEELQEYLAEIDARTVQLTQQVQSLKKSHTENERELAAAREAASRAQNETEARALSLKVSRWVATAEASRRGIEYTEQQIAYLTEERKLWENRHAVRVVSDADQLLAWEGEVDLLLQDIAERREIVVAQLEDMRNTRLDLEKRLAAWVDTIGPKDEVQSRLNAIVRRSDHASNYLASLISLERLAARLQTEIRAKQESKGLARQWATVKAEFDRFWNQQIVVVDDSALTPGKLFRAGVVFFLIVAAGILLKRLLLSRFMHVFEFGSKVTKTFTRDFISAVRRQTSTPFLLILALYFSLQTVPLGAGFDTQVTHVAVIATVVQFAIWTNASLTLFVERARRRREALDPSSVSAFGFMLFAGRIVIWAVAFLVVYGWYFGKEVTALMAGFGIGGIAIAFALQNILGDIFCSIAILLDRPFVVGDFITVGPESGVVEHIGIKTTRIRSITGEQAILSNADVLGSRIHNFKRMQERRIVFTLGVVYQTPREKLERVPGMVREIIESIPNTRFDRSHFKTFGPFSLDIETVYFVLISDYVTYMDIQQEINLKIHAKFEEEGIAFAYPTQELIVNMTPARTPTASQS